jgi:hypothetical protein
MKNLYEIEFVKYRIEIEQCKKVEMIEPYISYINKKLNGYDSGDHTYILAENEEHAVKKAYKLIERWCYGE